MGEAMGRVPKAECCKAAFKNVHFTRMVPWIMEAHQSSLGSAAESASLRMSRATATDTESSEAGPAFDADTR